MPSPINNAQINQVVQSRNQLFGGASETKREIAPHYRLSSQIGKNLFEKYDDGKRRNLFAVAMGDPFISGFGNGVEGAEFKKVVGLYYNALEGVPQDPSIQKHHPLIQQAAEAEKRLSRIVKTEDGSLKELHALAKQESERILSQEHSLMLGGWADKKVGGHAMLYAFEKQPSGCFKMTIYNSGAGIGNHSTSHQNDKIKNCPIFEIPDITREQIEDPGFMQMLLEPRKLCYWFDGVQYGVEDVYDRVLGYLKSDEQIAVICKENTEKFQDKRHITRQRAGTCTWSVLEAYFAMQAEKEEQYKLTKLCYQYRLIHDFFEKESEADRDGLTKSATANTLLKNAVEGFSRKGKKAFDRGWITREQYQEIHDLTSQINKALKLAKARCQKIYHEKNRPTLPDELEGQYSPKIEFSKARSEILSQLAPCEEKRLSPTGSLHSVLLPEMPSEERLEAAPSVVIRELVEAAEDLQKTGNQSALRYWCVKVWMNLPIPLDDTDTRSSFWTKMKPEEVDQVQEDLCRLSELMMTSCDQNDLYLSGPHYMLQKAIAVQQVLMSRSSRPVPERYILPSILSEELGVEGSKLAALFISPELSEQAEKLRQFFLSNYKYDESKQDKLHLMSSQANIETEVKEEILKSVDKVIAGGKTYDTFAEALAYLDDLRSFANEKLKANGKGDRFEQIMALYQDTEGEYDLPKSYYIGKRLCLMAQIFKLSNFSQQPLANGRFDVAIHFEKQKLTYKVNNNPLTLPPYDAFRDLNGQWNRVEGTEWEYKIRGKAEKWAIDLHNKPNQVTEEESFWLETINEGKSKLRLTRLFAYFSKHLNQLSRKEYQTFFDYHVWSFLELPQQLKDYPEIALTFVQMMNDGFHFFHGIKDFNGMLFCLRTQSRLRRFIERYVQANNELPFLEEDKNYEEMSSLFTSPAEQFQIERDRLASYLGAKPEFVLEADQKTLVERLLKGWFVYQSFNEQSQIGNREVNEEVETLFHDLYPLVQEVLQKEEGREVLLSLFRQMFPNRWKEGEPIPTIQGEFPLYTIEKDQDIFSVDIASGMSFINHRNISQLPVELTEQPEFIAAFGKNPTEASFKQYELMFEYKAKDYGTVDLKKMITPNQNAKIKEWRFRSEMGNECVFIEETTIGRYDCAQTERYFFQKIDGLWYQLVTKQELFKEENSFLNWGIISSHSLWIECMGHYRPQARFSENSEERIVSEGLFVESNGGKKIQVNYPGTKGNALQELSTGKSQIEKKCLRSISQTRDGKIQFLHPCFQLQEIRQNFYSPPKLYKTQEERLFLLTSFEDPHYLSIWKDEKGKIVQIEAPRYGLQFERKDSSRLGCVQHPGYFLCEQAPYFAMDGLYGGTLWLQNHEGKYKVLVPDLLAAPVRPSADPMNPFIQVSHSCSDKVQDPYKIESLRYAEYDFDEKRHRLEGSDCLDYLRLLQMSIATYNYSTQNGMNLALYYLEKSGKQGPYSAKEVLNLHDIFFVGRDEVVIKKPDCSAKALNLRMGIALKIMENQLLYHSLDRKENDPEVVEKLYKWMAQDFTDYLLNRGNAQVLSFSNQELLELANFLIERGLCSQEIFNFVLEHMKETEFPKEQLALMEENRIAEKLSGRNQDQETKEWKLKGILSSSTFSEALSKYKNDQTDFTGEELQEKMSWTRPQPHLFLGYFFEQALPMAIRMRNDEHVDEKKKITLLLRLRGAKSGNCPVSESLAALLNAVMEKRPVSAIPSMEKIENAVKKAKVKTDYLGHNDCAKIVHELADSFDNMKQKVREDLLRHVDLQNEQVSRWGIQRLEDAKRIAMESRKAEEPQSQVLQKPDEKQVNSNCLSDALHLDVYFHVEEVPFNQKQRAETGKMLDRLKEKAEDQIVKTRVDELQKGLESLYQQEDRGKLPKEYELKVATEQFLKDLEEKKIAGLDERKKRLLKKVKKLPEDRLDEKMARRGHLKKKITFDELLQLHVENEIALYLKRNPALTVEEVVEIRQETTQYLLDATWNQQIDRVIRLTKHQSKQTGLNQKLTVQKLAREFVAKRGSFDPIAQPELLVFEYRNNLLIRESQLEKHRILVEKCGSGEKKVKDAVVQMIMGGGKSTVLMPLYAFAAADGKSLPIMVVLSSLLDVTSKYLQTVMGDRFGRKIKTIVFNRDSDFSVKSLRYFRKTLQRMIQTKQLWLTTGESIQCLELKWFEILSVYANGDYDPKEAGIAKEQLLLLQDIRRMIRERGDLFIDEGHVTLNPRKELNFTIGQSNDFNPHCSELLLRFASVLTSDPEVSDLLRLRENLQAQGIDRCLDRLKEILIDDLFTYLRIPEQSQDECRAYLKNETREVPEWIQQLPDVKDLPKEEVPIKELLAVAKEEISSLLELTLRKTCDKDYGRSNRNDVALAIPFLAANTPNERARFGLSLEVANYTDFTYLQRKVKKEQIEDLVERQRENALKESAVEGTEILKTKAAIEFKEVFGEEFGNLFTVSPGSYERLAEMLFENKEQLLLFLKTYILPQIQIHTKKLRSNPTNLISQARSSQVVTGTPWNYESYHPSINQLSETGGRVFLETETDAKTVHLLKQKCEKRTHLMDFASSENVQTIMDRLCSRFMNVKESKHRALIDAGALFKGASNLQIAEMLLEKIKNPEIRGVIFFDRNAEDEDELMVLQKLGEGPATVTPYKKSLLQPHELFTFYDHNHTTGADIPQAPWAEAITTVGEMFLANLLQAVWRMRGLDQMQNIDLVIPTDISEGLLKSNRPSVDDCIGYCLTKQSYRQADDTFRGIKNALRDVPRSQVLDKMMVADFDQMVQLFEENIDLLVDDLDPSFFAKFGAPVEAASPTKVLRKIQDKIKEQMGHSESEDLVTFPTKDRLPLSVSNPMAEEEESTVQIHQETNEEMETQTLKELDEEGQDHNMRIEEQHSYRRQPLHDPQFFQGITFPMSFYVQKWGDFFPKNLEFTKNFYPIMVQDAGTRSRLVWNTHKKLPIRECLVMINERANPNERIKVIIGNASELGAYKKKLLMETIPSHFIIGIYDFDLRAIVQTGKRRFNPRQIEQDEELYRILSQIRLLRGDFNLNTKEKGYLLEWAKQHGSSNVIGLVEEIFVRHPAKRSQFYGSDFYRLLREL